MSKIGNFVKLSAFQYTSQIIIILSAIVYSFIAANFLGPEKYGLISYLMAFMGGIPLLFGFEAFSDVLKVYLARFKSRDFFKKTLLVSIVFLLIMWAAALILSGNIVTVIGKGDAQLVSFISILIILAPLLLVVQAAFVAFKQFGKLLKLVILQKVMDVAFLLIFLFVFKTDYMALFYSAVCSLTVIIALGLFILRKSNFTNIHVPRREVRKFTGQSFISNLLKGGSNQAEIWIFGLMMPLYEFGVFYLIRRIVSYMYEAPQQAISEVILPFLSEEKDKENLINYTSKVMKFQFLLSIFLSLVLIIVVPPFLKIFFSEYYSGVIMLPLIALCFLFNFPAPLIRLLMVFNKNWIISAAFVIDIVVNIALGLLLLPTYGLLGAAGVLCANRVIYSLFIYFACILQGYYIHIIPGKSDMLFFFKQTMVFIKRALNFFRKS